MNLILPMVTDISTAILALSGVVSLGYRVFVRPRMVVMDEKLERIEQHLAKINGSIARSEEWRHQHEVEHARREG